VTVERNGFHVVRVSQEPATERAASVTQLPAKGLGPWGQFLDPRGGSRASREGGRLTITVPGDIPRDLNPSPGFTLDAPRVLQPVDADFTIRVTVLPFPRPGPHTSYTNGADSYHGAGLVVWADERNLLRFELAGQARTSDGAPYTHLELFRDGRKTDEELRWTAAAPTHLQVERRGDSVFLRTSADGRAWTDFKTCKVTGMPPRVLVGVAAINSEAKEFAPQFEGWSLRSSGPASPELGPTGPSSAIAPAAIFGSGPPPTSSRRTSASDHSVA
jgi:regulation of enolase protein 1 (concanavalin A-like superfamily)